MAKDDDNDDEGEEEEAARCLSLVMQLKKLLLTDKLFYTFKITATIDTRRDKTVVQC